MPLLIPAILGLGGAAWGYFQGKDSSSTPRQPGAVENIVDDSASIAKWALAGFVVYLIAKKAKVI